MCQAYGGKFKSHYYISHAFLWEECENRGRYTAKTLETSKRNSQIYGTQIERSTETIIHRDQLVFFKRKKSKNLNRFFKTKCILP